MSRVSIMYSLKHIRGMVKPVTSASLGRHLRSAMVTHGFNICTTRLQAGDYKTGEGHTHLLYSTSSRSRGVPTPSHLCSGVGRHPRSLPLNLGVPGHQSHQYSTTTDNWTPLDRQWEDVLESAVRVQEVPSSELAVALDRLFTTLHHQRVAMSELPPPQAELASERYIASAALHDLVPLLMKGIGSKDSAIRDASVRVLTIGNQDGSLSQALFSHDVFRVLTLFLRRSSRASSDGLLLLSQLVCVDPYHVVGPEDMIPVVMKRTAEQSDADGTLGGLLTLALLAVVPAHHDGLLQAGALPFFHRMAQQFLAESDAVADEMAGAPPQLVYSLLGLSNLLSPDPVPIDTDDEDDDQDNGQSQGADTTAARAYFERYRIYETMLQCASKSQVPEVIHLALTALGKGLRGCQNPDILAALAATFASTVDRVLGDTRVPFTIRAVTVPSCIADILGHLEDYQAEQLKQSLVEHDIMTKVYDLIAEAEGVSGAEEGLMGPITHALKLLFTPNKVTQDQIMTMFGHVSQRIHHPEPSVIHALTFLALAIEEPTRPDLLKFATALGLVPMLLTHLSIVVRQNQNQESEDIDDPEAYDLQEDDGQGHIQAVSLVGLHILSRIVNEGEDDDNFLAQPEWRDTLVAYLCLVNVSDADADAAAHAAFILCNLGQRYEWFAESLVPSLPLVQQEVFDFMGEHGPKDPRYERVGNYLIMMRHMMNAATE